MTYIVWHEVGAYEGWQPSDQFTSLDECFDHIHRNTYGGKYEITSPVDVGFVDLTLNGDGDA